jgi:uncharacterized membrane protein (DUF2068 family)
MRTLDQSVRKLVEDLMITLEVAREKSVYPQYFQKITQVTGAGKVAKKKWEKYFAVVAQAIIFGFHPFSWCGSTSVTVIVKYYWIVNQLLRVSFLERQLPRS